MAQTFDIERIEDKVDKVVAASTGISMSLGGVQFQNMIEVMEFAKLMAISGAAVKPYFRGNPGACLGICSRALRFGFEPFALAEHAYLMIKKGYGDDPDEETLGFDSAVIGAVINAHGNLTGSLKPTYEGEGEAMKLIVSGVLKGETLSIETPTVGAIKEALGKSAKGYLRGSPLWNTNPRQQIWYRGRVLWCRYHRPEILLGWFDHDEELERGGRVIEHQGSTAVVMSADKGPRASGLGERLKGPQAGDRGFDPGKIDSTINGGPAAKEPPPVASAASQGGEGAPTGDRVASVPVGAPTESSPSESTGGDGAALAETPTLGASAASPQSSPATAPQPTGEDGAASGSKPDAAPPGAKPRTRKKEEEPQQNNAEIARQAGARAAQVNAGRKTNPYKEKPTAQIVEGSLAWAWDEAYTAEKAAIERGKKDV